MPIKITRDEIRTIYRQGEEAVITLVETLVDRINAHEERITKLEGQINKNSHNSHKPPSSDGFKKTPVNHRTKSNRKSGGQPGHPGTTLQMSDHPDTIINCTINEYCDCGFSISGIDPFDFEKRQEFEIQILRPKITEYRAAKKRCPKCGKTHKAQFPNDIRATVQYGSKTKATALYLSHYQLIPMERTTEIFANLFSLPISEGSLNTFAQLAYDGLEKTEQVIVDNITNAKVAHFDESGMYVDKKRGWLNVAGTKLFTRYFFHEKRGKEAMDAAGILPNFKGVAIHDGYRSYFTYEECDHGLCNVHHGRDLIFECEQCKQKWAAEMKEHLLNIKECVETAKEKNLPCLTKKEIVSFEKKYNKIIEQGYKENPKVKKPKPPGKRGRQAQSSSQNLLDHLKKYKVETLRFMHDFNVPFENNQAERDGRMVKLQQKISGCFRSKEGAERFCRVRSYISTVKKHGYNIFDSLKSVFIVNDGTKCLLPSPE
jgi:transposase